MSTEHNQSTPPAAPASAGGFKYFLPGLIVGFIIGGVVGVLLPEFVDRGGPRLQAPVGSGNPQTHTEEERLNEKAIPADEVPVDTEGTTAPDAAPATSGGH